MALSHAPDAGHAYGPLAVYQVGFSENCNNPSFCGASNLGGFWGWAEFDRDGTADAQLTDCSHLQGGGPAAGAQHYSVAVSALNQAPGWDIGPNGDFFITNETDTFTGRSGGPPQTVFDAFPPYPSDTHIPAAPGHYNAARLLGFTAPPGVSIQIQVTQLSH
jgi:hypothetical protein